MEGFSFENQGSRTYLTYTITASDVIDSMSLGMLTNNKIPGLAHTLFTQIDATKLIKYDVSSKISVRQFFTGPVNRKRLVGVFSGIVDAMLSAEEYMIDVNSIILDLDYIFADVSSCETVLICMPVISDDFSKRDLRAFFKNIMFSTQFDQTENCDHVAKLINYLNSSPVFSLEDFKKILVEISTGSASAQLQQPVAYQGYAPQQVQQPQPVQQRQPAPVQQPPQPQVQPAQQRQQAPVQQPPQQKAAPQPMANQGNVPVPPAQSQGSQQMPPAQQGAGEKKMSMFNLLMHYNKENAELYKAQKAAKKASQAQPAPGPMPGSAPAQTPVPAPKSKQQPQAGFAVPGQNPPANQGFAVPGQNPPANQGFAVPGQNPPANQSFQAPGQKAPANQGFAAPGQNPPANQSFQAPGQKTPANQGFAVPGQNPPANQSFQAPGQKTPANQGFAVPGQNPPANQGFAIPDKQPHISSYQRPAQPSVPKNGAAVPAQPQAVQMNSQPAYAPAMQMPQGQSMNFGETVVLDGGGGIGETTVLGASAAAQIKPYLVRAKNNEKIMIDKPVFRIGKERSYVDYFIGDNSAISRSHANIITRDGEYFVVDTNSTNHTYVNGAMIQSNVETKIAHGARIKLANEDFELKLF